MEFLDLKTQYQSLKSEIDQAVQRVFQSGVFIGGQEVESFEREMAEFCGVAHAIGVNSGTEALFLSLRALGIGAGDEVITTPFTFISTVEVIVNVGAKPVFVDIQPDTFNIEPSLIEAKITAKTKAIIPVHLFGQVSDMKEIMEIAKKNNLYVIEDAAQAAGASYGEQHAGSIGDAGCFSFFPSKNLGAYGDGGMVVTNNKEIARQIRLLKQHGSSSTNKFYCVVIGTNSRLDALQATILRIKLKYLELWNTQRAKNAAFYSEGLKKFDNIRIPITASCRSHIFHQYTISVPKKTRAQMQQHLQKAGIPTIVYFPSPLYLQPAFQYLGYKQGDFPETEQASQSVLSLPIYPELTKDAQGHVIQQIKEFNNPTFF